MKWIRLGGRVTVFDETAASYQRLGKLLGETIEGIKECKTKSFAHPSVSMCL